MTKKKNCPPGTTWDNLVNTCIQGWAETRPEPPTELTPVFQQRSTSPAARADPDIALNPVLWIVVVLTTLGSIMALALWFIIYKRQSRLGRTSAEEMESAPEPLRKIQPPLESHLSTSATLTPLACAHSYNPGSGSTSKREEAFANCRGPPKCQKTTDRAEEVGVLPVFSAKREHRVPLPATELGDTALVTTKTV
ncbi:tumor necrosis factor receptor superfamily member 13C-like [Hippocampus zosterae]|uniref:tumor necrosis factor receptor superfamily member 13C-like n=1 Tax=Hippocampus zosterae TaxID=109293 RepID=UPI00223D3871|nr:tumor necrosis factor receptor superfamily member 13C-like [Hippocampus zosterae]